jgi:hypothetical protein
MANPAPIAKGALTKLKNWYTAYRGGINQAESEMAPGKLFLTTDKKSAAQYGDVTKHQVPSNLKLLDLTHSNDDARRVVFSAANPNMLKEYGIKTPNDFKVNSDAFDEIANDSSGMSELSIGMFPGPKAGSILNAFGYDGVKTGAYDFWIPSGLTKTPTQKAQGGLAQACSCHQ